MYDELEGRIQELRRRAFVVSAKDPLGSSALRELAANLEELSHLRKWQSRQRIQLVFTIFAFVVVTAAMFGTESQRHYWKGQAEACQQGK